MAQTFFIDADEEIISVIGYLRQSPDIENYFVFPKRSLVLQSAVNLRLFLREAQQSGKHITVISQDEGGRKLAERVGISTKEYATEVGALRQETPPPAAHLAEMSTPAVAPRPFAPPASASIPLPSPALPSVDYIGSNSFDRGASANLPLPPSAPPAETATSVNARRLMVKDRSPQYQTALNSSREPVTQAREPMDTPAFAQNPALRAVPGAGRDVGAYRPATSAPDVSADTSPGRDQRLERFFQRDPATEYAPSSARISPVMPVTPRATFSKENEGGLSRPEFAPPVSGGQASSSSWSAAIWISSILIVLAGSGLAVYYLIPKAMVLITPYETTEDVAAKYVGRLIVPVDGEGGEVVPVRKIEKIYTSKAAVPASGKALANNQKARGTIVISNEYSSDPQPLIATTRFMAPDGKIFRLLESVVVPGVTVLDGKRAPGMLEVLVVADAPGEASNIDPTTFTIPGFQGGPKYNVIRATSTKAFTGGGAGSESLVTVTKEDTDKALQQLKSQSRQDFLDTLAAELLPDERIIDDSIEITDQGKNTVPAVGSLGETADVEGSFLGRAFVVSEKMLREKLTREHAPDRRGVNFDVSQAVFSFENVLPNYGEDQLQFSVQATLTLISVIDTDAVRRDLLGQDETGIKTVLEKHPEIRKIEVEFSPEFLFQAVPTRESRVNVRVVAVD